MSKVANLKVGHERKKKKKERKREKKVGESWQMRRTIESAGGNSVRAAEWAKGDDADADWVVVVVVASGRPSAGVAR